MLRFDAPCEQRGRSFVACAGEVAASGRGVGSPEASTVAEVQPPLRRAPASPPPEAWRRLQELEARVSSINQQLKASQAVDSRHTSRHTSRTSSRAPSRAAATAPHEHAPAAAAAVPELAERLARIEVAERQIYAKWFTASGAPRDSCSGGSISPTLSDGSSGRSGVPSSAASPARRPDRVPCQTPSDPPFNKSPRLRRVEHGTTTCTAPELHMHEGAGAAKQEELSIGKGRCEASGGGVNAAAGELERQGGVQGGVGSGCCSRQNDALLDAAAAPERRVSANTGLESPRLGPENNSRPVAGSTQCAGDPQGGEGGNSLFTDEEVERILKERQRVLERRAARNACIAAASGLGSSAAIAAAVVTGAAPGLPIGHGGCLGRGPKLEEVDIVAMAEAAAEQVVDDLVEEHVDEMLQVCDNAVDWLFAAEFAPWPDEA